MKSPSENILRFDPEAHKYWIGKKRIPGVSEIMQKVGLAKNYDGVDPFYRDRGIATHKAIELYLKGILDQSSLDPAIKPCFEAFLAYQKEHPLGKVLALEKPMVDASESFSGTPDLITDRAIFDWKCSKSHDKVAELQGQAYKILSLHTIKETLLKFPFIVVELHADDATYTEFNYGSEYEEWESVMNLYRWKTKRPSPASSASLKRGLSYSVELWSKRFWKAGRRRCGSVKAAQI